MTDLTDAQSARREFLTKKSHRYGRALLLTAPLIVYLILPTRNYYWDGVAFAIDAEKSLSLGATFHPNHLMYTAVSGWLYRLVLAAGLHIRALSLMQFMSSVSAEASVLLVYRAIRRDGLARGAAVTGALFLAFAGTWWKFATDANAYIPCIALILAANDLLESRGHPALAGAAQGAAMLFHELAILFLPVALLRLFNAKSRLAYLSASLLPCGIAYVFAWHSISGNLNIAGLLHWATYHSPDSAFSWQPLRNVGLTLLGTLRLFLGGRPGAVRHDAVVIIGVIALITCAIPLAIHLWRGGPLRLTGVPRDLALWVGIYVGFLFFWMPQNTFYRLFYLAPLVLILSRALRRVRTDRVTAPLACTMLFLSNLTFLMYPGSRAVNNAPLAFALRQAQHWPAGTPIAFHRFEPDLWTISYFNPQVSWIGLDTVDIRRLDQISVAAQERKQSLWLDASAYEFISGNPLGREWLATAGRRELVEGDSKHEFKFYQIGGTSARR